MHLKTISFAFLILTATLVFGQNEAKITSLNEKIASLNLDKEKAETKSTTLTNELDELTKELSEKKES